MSRSALIAILALSACRPISNQALYEDARFLNALPDASRISPPEGFLDDGSAPESLVYAMIVDRCQALADGSGQLASLRQAMTARDPDIADENRRSWEAVPLVTESEGTLGWLRVGIETTNGSDFAWGVEVGPSDEGPWVNIGEGTHDHEDQTGTVRWRPRTDDGTFSPLGELEGSYDESGDQRLVDWAWSPPRNLVQTWSFVGYGQVTISGELPTEEGGEAAGNAWAVISDEGGRGEAAWFDGVSDPVRTECWSPSGEPVWVVSGDGESTGSESACGLAAPEG